MYFPLRRSDATFLMLSNITGLRLHPLAPEESDTEEQGTLLKDISGSFLRRQLMIANYRVKKFVKKSQ